MVKRKLAILVGVFGMIIGSTILAGCQKSETASEKET